MRDEFVSALAAASISSPFLGWCLTGLRKDWLKPGKPRGDANIDFILSDISAGRMAIGPCPYGNPAALALAVRGADADAMLDVGWDSWMAGLMRGRLHLVLMSARTSLMTMQLPLESLEDRMKREKEEKEAAKKTAKEGKLPGKKEPPRPASKEPERGNLRLIIPMVRSAEAYVGDPGRVRLDIRRLGERAIPPLDIEGGPALQSIPLFEMDENSRKS